MAESHKRSRKHSHRTLSETLIALVNRSAVLQLFTKVQWFTESIQPRKCM